MDLGTIGLVIATEGEAEARAKIESYVRAVDAATDSLDEAAMRAEKAAAAKERAIQREIKAYDGVVKEMSSLKRAYQDLAASFDPVNKAQLSYSRNLEMLNKALEEQIITEQQYGRVLEQLELQMAGTIQKERVRQLETEERAQRENNKTISDAQKSYDGLLSKLDPTYAAQMKYARSLEIVDNAVQQLIITEAQRGKVVAALQNQLDKDLSAPKVLQLEREAEETRRVKEENDRLAAAYGRLEASVNPAVRANQLFAQSQETVNRALAAGLINADQAQATMMDVQTTMERMGHTFNQHGQVLSKTNTAWAHWARGGIQQAGYQVGDFFIQMQMGTPFMIAFAQQGSQLLGTLGKWGAIAGAAVAIMGALYTIIRAMIPATKTLSDILKDSTKTLGEMNDALDKIDSYDFDNVLSGMVQQAGSIRQQFSDILKVVEEVQKTKLQDSIQKLQDDTGLEAYIKRFNTKNSLASQLDVGTPEFDFMGLKSANEGRFVNNAINTIGGDSREEILKSVEYATEMLMLRGLLTDEVKAYLALLGDELGLEGMLTEEQKKRLEIVDARGKRADDAFQALVKENEERRKGSAAAGDMIKALSDQIQVEKAIAQYGADSADVDRARAANEREIYEAKVKSLPVSEGIVKGVMSLYDYTQKLKNTNEENAEIERKTLEIQTARNAELNAEMQRKAASRATMSEMRGDIEKQLVVEQRIAQYGADSLEVKKLVAAQERAVYQQKVQANASSVEEVNRAMDLYDILQKIVDENRKRADDEAKILAIQTARNAELEAERKQKSQNQTTLAEMRVDLEKQLIIEREIAQYGEDSYQVKSRQAAQERALYQQKVQLLATSVEEVEEAMNLYDAVVLAQGATQGLSWEAANAKAEFEAIAGVIAGIAGQIASINFSNVGKEAQLAALQAGKTVEAARMLGDIATERARLAPALGAEDGAVRAAANAQLNEYVAGKERELAVETEIAAVVDSRKPAKSGGGAKREQEDPLVKLRQQIALEGELLYMSEAQQRVVQALGESRAKYSQAEIEAVAAEIEALERKKKALEEQQQIADTIQSSMEEAFMSMLGGAKSAEDAFRQMALSIIQELYRVLVVQRLVGSFNAGTGVGSGIMGFLGKGISSFTGMFANGGVISNGSNVTAFADGGVVSSPTNFPMKNGMGLMGEAGPEAILPLKRDSNGKLGVQTQSPPQVNQKIINVLDPRIVGQYLQTAEGEKVIMNVMRRRGR